MALADHKRDVNYLTAAMADPESTEMKDLKLILLQKPNELLKNAATQSVLDYFANIQEEMIALYSVFIVFLFVCSGVFFAIVFRRLRQTMWNTNILLRIIPVQQCFDRETQRELHKFNHSIFIYISL